MQCTDFVLYHRFTSIYISAETTSNIIYIYGYGHSSELQQLTRGSFYYDGLTLIPTLISNYIHDKAWYKISYPFLNLNGANVEAWESISDFAQHIIGHVINYSCWD